MELSLFDTELTPQRDMIEAFGGMNHNLRISDSEWYDTQNLTTDHYPIAGPRNPRGTYIHASNPGGLIAKDTLVHVDGNTLYVNKAAVQGLVLTVGKKQLISMGAYIIIMPDRKYVNTADLTDYGDIDNVTSYSGTVRYKLCQLDGTEYGTRTASNTAPTNPTDGMIWVDTSSSPHVVQQYSSYSSMWIGIATVYIKIAAPNIAMGFSDYDGVEISGLDEDSTVVGLEGLADLNKKTSVLQKAYHDPGDTAAGRAEGTNDYLVVIGLIDSDGSHYSTRRVYFKRKMPQMDFIIESENRLWGCFYGIGEDGKVLNEIYASKLGDFKNWRCYMGVSTDSYAASCGTDGQWTGAITHLGFPLFFKENVLHKVYGQFPSNFQIQTTACRGVQKGAGKSLAIVNETLFYKGRNGVCAYDGSLPIEMSQALGQSHFSGVDDSNTDALRNGAVGGAHNGKYYISMKDENSGEWGLYVYDTMRDMWIHEDGLRADDICSCRDDLYITDHDTGDIIIETGGEEPTEGRVSWMATTGDLGLSSPDHKYISKLNVRMSLAKGSVVHILIEYDSDGQWHHVSETVGTDFRAFTMPIRTRRCDHLRLKFSGVGEAKIYSISKTIAEGSDSR